MSSDPGPVGNSPAPDSPTPPLGGALKEHGFRSRVAPVLVKAMPWVSLAWGLVSGTLVARRFEDATRVLAFAVGLLVVSVCLGLWGGWVERRSRAAAATGEPDASGESPVAIESASAGQASSAGLAAGSAAPAATPRAARLGGLLRRNEGRIEWLVTTGKQIFSQYILMFSIPFLWNTRAWFHLAFCVALVASTLWDPLFFRAVRWPAYRLLLRATALALATSFVVGVSFPSFVAGYDLLALGAALFGAIPIAAVAGGPGGGRKGALASLIPLTLIALCAFAHARLGGAWRFPVLSLWVKTPSFELQDGNDAWIGREDRGESLDAGDVARAIAEGGRLCCVTPLMASKRLQSEVVHEWWSEGVLLEAIELPAVRGRDEASAYRTYSCKRNIPGGDLASVACRVWIGTKRGPRAYVGEVPFAAR